VLDIQFFHRATYMLEKPEGAIKNDQSRGIGNIGHAKNRLKTKTKQNTEN
jgi:hypothetical protein